MVDDELSFDDIFEALKRIVPGHADSSYRIAALRVHFNYETYGPVSEADRLVLGGEDRSDADILIDRTLVEIAERNAERRNEPPNV